jgi:hypothetical protein
MTTGTLPNPEKALAQRRAAIKRACAVRDERVAIRRQLRAGTKTVGDILTEPCCATATLYQMLVAQYRWGDRRAIEFLSKLGNDWRTPISPMRKLQDLTERQIEVLRRALEGRT